MSRNHPTETRSLADMNITINDAAALELITPDAMTAMIEKNGYREVREQTREMDGVETVIARHYRLPAGQKADHDGQWVIVCLISDFSDYGIRTAEFLKDMACATGRSQLSLWFELTGFPTDGLPRIPARTDR